MLKYNHIPPKEAGDVEFLPSFRHELKETRLYGQLWKDIGRNVGRSLVGNMKPDDIDIKTALMLALDLGEGCVELQESDNTFANLGMMSCYMRGAVEGAYDEAEEHERATRRMVEA